MEAVILNRKLTFDLCSSVSLLPQMLLCFLLHLAVGYTIKKESNCAVFQISRK